MASEREICLRCGLPLATRADIGTLEPGDDAGLCWSTPTIGGCICEPVDWQAAIKRMAIALGMSSTSTIEEVEARVANAQKSAAAAWEEADRANARVAETWVVPEGEDRSAAPFWAVDEDMPDGEFFDEVFQRWVDYSDTKGLWALHDRITAPYREALDDKTIGYARECERLKVELAAAREQAGAAERERDEARAGALTTMVHVEREVEAARAEAAAAREEGRREGLREAAEALDAEAESADEHLPRRVGAVLRVMAERVRELAVFPGASKAIDADHQIDTARAEGVEQGRREGDARARTAAEQIVTIAQRGGRKRGNPLHDGLMAIADALAPASPKAALAEVLRNRGPRCRTTDGHDRCVRDSDHRGGCVFDVSEPEASYKASPAAPQAGDDVEFVLRDRGVVSMVSDEGVATVRRAWGQSSVLVDVSELRVVAPKAAPPEPDDEPCDVPYADNCPACDGEPDPEEGCDDCDGTGVRPEPPKLLHILYEDGSTKCGLWSGATVTFHHERATCPDCMAKAPEPPATPPQPSLASPPMTCPVLGRPCREHMHCEDDCPESAAAATQSDPVCAVCEEPIGMRPATQGYIDGQWRHDVCAEREGYVDRKRAAAPPHGGTDADRPRFFRNGYEGSPVRCEHGDCTRFARKMHDGVGFRCDLHPPATPTAPKGPEPGEVEHLRAEIDRLATEMTAALSCKAAAVAHGVDAPVFLRWVNPIAQDGAIDHEHIVAVFEIDGGQVMSEPLAVDLAPQGVDAGQGEPVTCTPFVDVEAPRCRVEDIQTGTGLRSRVIVPLGGVEHALTPEDALWLHHDLGMAVCESMGPKLTKEPGPAACPLPEGGPADGVVLFDEDGAATAVVSPERVAAALAEPVDESESYVPAAGEWVTPWRAFDDEEFPRLGWEEEMMPSPRVSDLESALQWWMRYAANGDGLLRRFAKHAVGRGDGDVNSEDRLHRTMAHLREGDSVVWPADVLRARLGLEQVPPRADGWPST